MDKKLQDLAWSVLPKEFKEEVKKLYVEIEVELSKKKGATDKHTWQLRGMKSQLAYFFGAHNLTSDVEEEEMLAVSRKRVQEMYAHYDAISTDPNRPKDYIESVYEYADGVTVALDDLFGSKCLPDEEPKPAEPKFKVGEKVMYKGVLRVIDLIDTVTHRYHLSNGNYYAEWIDESELEPYTEPTDKNPKENANTFAFGNPINTKSGEFDRILKDSFRNERRLNIAATITAGVMANPKIIESRNGLKAISDKWLATRTLELADVIIAESEKGGAVGNS